jgi:hypothetical protein
MHRENVYFSAEFCHFYMGHIKNYFFLKSLLGHIGLEMYTQYFCLIFFDIFKFVKHNFQIIGAYAPGSRNAMSIFWKV